MDVALYAGLNSPAEPQQALELIFGAHKFFQHRLNLQIFQKKKTTKNPAVFSNRFLLFFALSLWRKDSK